MRRRNEREREMGGERDVIAVLGWQLFAYVCVAAATFAASPAATQCGNIKTSNLKLKSCSSSWSSTGVIIDTVDVCFLLRVGARKTEERGGVGVGAGDERQS